MSLLQPLSDGTAEKILLALSIMDDMSVVTDWFDVDGHATKLHVRHAKVQRVKDAVVEEPAGSYSGVAPAYIVDPIERHHAEEWAQYNKQEFITVDSFVITVTCDDAFGFTDTCEQRGSLPRRIEMLLQKSYFRYLTLKAMGR